MEITEPLRELVARRTSDTLVGAMGVFILLNTGVILIPLLKTFYDVSTKSAVIKQDVTDILKDKANEEKLVEDRGLKLNALKEREKSLALGDVSFYLETFSSYAGEAGVRLKAVRPIPLPLARSKEIKQDENYRGTYFEISAGAGYHSLGRFIQRIESYPSFVKIVRLSVRSVDDSPLEHDVDMLIKMVVQADQVKDAPAQKT
jgi:hypothetical protein